MKKNPIRTREYLHQEYTVKERSIGDIAVEHNTYPNKIRRELIHYGEPLRDKSEAQSAALKSGRHCHPTKGRERPEEVKGRIGKNVSATWKNISPEEKSRRSEVAKKQWESMSAEEREQFRTKAARAVRVSSQIGSKMERFIFAKFVENGVTVEAHKKDFLSYTKLVVDLFLPKYNTVVEIDGPAHYIDIWGEDALARQQKDDMTKNGILMSMGFVVVRVKIMRKNISKVFQEEVFAALFKKLEEIMLSPPANIEDRLIYLEVE
jgi:very-short-patch-repair endonuclease